MEKVFDSILSWEGGNTNKKYLVSPRTVSEFFSKGIHLLRIPDYQRPYSWSKKNIIDLLNDVSNLSKKSKTSSWFLGPIFTVKQSTESQYADLLDGQQRITTIQIILREASLILYEEDEISLAEFKGLDKRISKVIQVCKQCLVRMDGFDEIPIFETENQLRSIFKKYIIDLNDIEDSKDLKTKRSNFHERVSKIRLEGSISAGTILTAIEVVRDFFKREFISDSKNVERNFENFYKFIDALVNRCWLIEIPLQTHEDSIQIFESLNNRGKSLTLVDKLRYKSIVSSSRKILDEVRDKWKRIYSGLNFLIDSDFVKNEDDFFKVFFNSINGDDITKEDAFIEIFSKKYLVTDKSIISFLDETLKIFEFFRFLSSSLDEKNIFISDYFKPSEQDKVKALFQLLKQTLEISDNSRFLLFYALRKYPNYQRSNYVLIQAIWNIIRYVYYEEIFKSVKSNRIRNYYLDLIKKLNSGEQTINDATEVNKFTHLKTIQNLIKSVNNSESKFVIYLYTYLNNYSSLISYSPSQYKKSHLDHLFPKAWKSDWSDKTYTKDEVLEYLEELLKSNPSLFELISHSQLILDVKSSESLELISYVTSPYRQVDSLVEYIGNKWVLHAGTNIKTSNNNFEFKRNKYQDDKWIKVPANSDDLVGMNVYDSWSYKEILLRSLYIVNGIISNIKVQWDDIN